MEEELPEKMDLQSLNGVTAAVHKHRSLLDSDQAKKDLEKAQDEWESVCTVLPDGKVAQPVNTALVTVKEVVEYFKTKDMSSYMTNIVPVMERSPVSMMFRIMWGPPKLNPSLEEERNLVFAIASCPFQNDELIHNQVLHSIYKQLTNTIRDCPRFGPHWEQIGFQGNDPSTDLRGVGFLGLIHLLHLIMNPDTLALARAILKLSHHETKNFPFAVMGINLTRIVLQTLREERLNRECNRRNNVIDLTNEFYVGIFLHLYNIWNKNEVTIERSGWVLKDVETFAKKKPKQVFRDLNAYIQERQKTEAADAKQEDAITCSTNQSQETQSLPTIFSELEKEIRYADDEYFI